MHPVGAELFNMDRQTDRQMNSQADMMKLITHFHNFANAPKHHIFILMANFTINDSGNMKQVQKIGNYLRLEARVQCHNKWMPQSKDQSFLFRYGVSHTATIDDV